MQYGHARSLMELRQQHCRVAVPAKELRAPPHRAEVDPRRQVVRSVSAARAQNSSDIIMLQESVEVRAPPLARAGEVAFSIEYCFPDFCLVSKLAQRIETAVKLLRIHRTRRCDDSDAVSPLQRTRLDQRHRPSLKPCLAAADNPCLAVQFDRVSEFDKLRAARRRHVYRIIDELSMVARDGGGAASGS